MRYWFLAILSCLLPWTLLGLSVSKGEKADIVVAVNGGGDFKSIQEAINSLESLERKPVVILVRNGVYNEKVLIQKSNITIVGEDRDSTRIVFAELRENWNKDHKGSDWGAGVVNIDTGVTDITIANLTVYNNYGWQNGVFNKHQFAIRGAGTRIILLNCKVISDGGDALSLWNKQNGMYYHAGCYFEGWVDYVCPRGWCYITHSRFFGHNLSASLWHDGDYNKSQKFVIRDSYFDGVPGFPLGRNHRDGQIYLLDCRFSERMADRPIYHPESSKTEWQWGPRHYYHDCHREGGDFAWFRNNLSTAEHSPESQEITARWAFDGAWDPEASMASVLPFAFLPDPRWNTSGIVTDGVKLAWIGGRNCDSHNVYFGTDENPGFQRNQKELHFETGRLTPGTTYHWRVDEVTGDSVVTGETWSFRTVDLPK